MTEKLDREQHSFLNRLAADVYAISASKGFHSSSEPTIGDYVSNLHGEVSELWEAYRKKELDKPCEKSSHMEEPISCAGEELADIIIRALDMAHQLNVDIGKAVYIKSRYNESRPFRHGGKLA